MPRESKAPGIAETRLAGEQSARNREHLLRNCTDIDGLVYAALHRLAGNQP